MFYLKQVGTMVRQVGAVIALICIDLSAVGISFVLGYLVRDYLLINLFPTTFNTKLIGVTLDHVWWGEC